VFCTELALSVLSTFYTWVLGRRKGRKCSLYRLFGRESRCVDACVSSSHPPWFDPSLAASRTGEAIGIDASCVCLSGHASLPTGPASRVETQLWLYRIQIACVAQANEKLHLAWCVFGVVGCLMLYGVLQVKGNGESVTAGPS